MMWYPPLAYIVLDQFRLPLDAETERARAPELLE